MAGIWGVASAQGVGDILRCLVLTEEEGVLTLECEAEVASTPVPEPTVAPTVTPSAPIAPFAGAPACTTHDDRAWHSLWNEQLGCHYDHHHGDDPSVLNDVFGTDIYAITGGIFGYPWQTFSTAGLENQLKHEGYVVQERKGLTCPTSPGLGCITDFRMVVHQMADGHDTPVRHHSYWAEVRGCVNADLNDCGYMRIGGWQDTGVLEVDALPVIVPEGAHNRVKQHSSTAPGAVWYPSSQVAENGQQGLFRGSLTIYDMWDYTDPTAPEEFTDRVCWPGPRCRINATNYFPHLILMDIPAEFEDIVDPDNNGYADYEGWVNRWGTIVTGCTEVGLDCIPLKLVHVRTNVDYSIEGLGGGPARDYDIYFAGRPSGWQRPPGE